MAELTPGAPATAVPSDPRAVRVRLAPASRQADEPAIRVSPPVEPLRMGNPTTGRGPLGGAAVPAAAPNPATPRDGEPLDDHLPLVDGVPTDVALHTAGPTRFVLAEAGGRTRLVIEPALPAEGGVTRREVLVDGFRFDVDAEPERIAALRERATRGRAASGHGGPLEVKAIIPGKVVSISVKPGDAVTAGQQLLVVEAMKMQNELRAPRDGTISRVGVVQGANIDVGDLLVVIS
jgi:biotin carboxyl carrier protein